MMMKLSAISRRKAEWIGMAASVAGGFVAVAHDAPRLCYVSREQMARWKRYAADGDEAVAAYIRRCHHVAGRGWLYLTLDPGRNAEYILAAPAGHGLAHDGVPVPRSLRGEVVAALRAAGYSIQD